MKLTEQQMYDYMFCPAKYDLKYNKLINIEEQKTLNHLLNKVAKYFYVNLMNEKVLSLNALQKKWDSICETNTDYINNKKSLDGLFLIKKMYEWAKQNQIYILDVDTKYNIVIGDIELIGNMNPIMITKNKKFELIDTDFGTKIKDQIDVDMKLKYSIDSYSFKKLNDQEIDGVRIHNVKTNTDLFTKKSEPDYRRMKSTIKGVAEGIRNNIYYPREQVLCTNCTARDYCKYWYSKIN